MAVYSPKVHQVTGEITELPVRADCGMWINRADLATRDPKKVTCARCRAYTGKSHRNILNEIEDLARNAKGGMVPAEDLLRILNRRAS